MVRIQGFWLVAGVAVAGAAAAFVVVVTVKAVTAVTSYVSSVKRADDEAARRKTAEDKLKAETARREAVEKLWNAGVPPEYVPSVEESVQAKKRVGYRGGRVNVAIAGASGTGKSSLINSFRGLKKKDAGAADVDTFETTREISGYDCAPFNWFDVPGAGTANTRGWQYFKEQRLYIFDAMIVLMGDRFLESDLSLLEKCMKFEIPTYLVRSKADVHIRNISEVDEVDYGTAREKFVADTRMSVRSNLERTCLPSDQKVYIVTARVLREFAAMTKSLHFTKTSSTHDAPSEAIDEYDLLRVLCLLSS